MCDRHLYWERAFPQYSLGYSSFLDSLKKMEMELPGLLYAGMVFYAFFSSSDILKE